MVLSRREIWLLVGVETVALAALAAWILWRLDRLFEPIGIIGAIAIIALGDLVTVFVMQRFAPTEITLNPGEAAHAHGKIVSGFDDGNGGVVLVRGERWRARCADTAQLAPGDLVRIVSRIGLTLVVEAIEPEQQRPELPASGSSHR